MYLVSGTGSIAAHGVATLLDSRKGSLTNRAECAKEHFKNDINTAVKLGVPVAGIAYVAVKKPGLLTKIFVKGAKEVGKLFAKFGKKLTNKKGFSLIGKGLSKAAAFIAKHPVSTGVGGAIAAAGIYLLNTVAKYANKEGRIEQKYEDAAKIESSTKNLVLVDSYEDLRGRYIK